MDEPPQVFAQSFFASFVHSLDFFSDVAFAAFFAFLGSLSTLEIVINSALLDANTGAVIPPMNNAITKMANTFFMIIRF